MASSRNPSPALIHRRPMRLWSSAVLGVCIGLTFLLTPIFLALGFLVEKSWLIWAIGSLAALALGIVLFLLMSARIHCRVCANPLLIEKHCNKHPMAKRLFGSYVLRASLSTATRGVCRCMYCNEPNYSYGGRRRVSHQQSTQEAFRASRENFELQQAVQFQNQMLAAREKTLETPTQDTPRDSTVKESVLPQAS